MKGDWVVNGIGGTQPNFGIVKGIWDDGMGKTVDVVYYDCDGNKLGRVSPAMGGPTDFEPALDFDDLTVIEVPVFPLRRGMMGDYNKEFVEKS